MVVALIFNVNILAAQKEDLQQNLALLNHLKFYVSLQGSYDFLSGLSTQSIIKYLHIGNFNFLYLSCLTCNIRVDNNLA